jgi:hypothetical protein
MGGGNPLERRIEIFNADAVSYLIGRSGVHDDHPTSVNGDNFAFEPLIVVLV